MVLAADSARKESRRTRHRIRRGNYAALAIKSKAMQVTASNVPMLNDTLRFSVTTAECPMCHGC